MEPIPPHAPDVPAAARPLASKPNKAGAEFEALLLDMVLGPVQRSFTHLPGGKEEHANKAYSGLAMQALTADLAQHGGMGLGRIISSALNARIWSGNASAGSIRGHHTSGSGTPAAAALAPAATIRRVQEKVVKDF